MKKWFTLFGRESPTQTEMKAGIIIRCIGTNVAIFRTCAGGFSRIQRVPRCVVGPNHQGEEGCSGLGLPNFISWVLIEFLRFQDYPISYRLNALIYFCVHLSHTDYLHLQVEACKSAMDWRALASDVLTAERRSKGTRQNAKLYMSSTLHLI